MKNREFISFILILLSMGVARAEFNESVEPAIGSGVSSLNLSIQDQGETINYEGTNRNYYFLNLGFRNLSFQIKAPLPDPESSRKARGDTSIIDYQISLALSRHWIADLTYQKYSGYFTSYKSVEYVNSGLSIANMGALVTYVFNEDYAAQMVRTTSWEQKKNAGSWMLSTGYGKFILEGDVAPRALGTRLRDSLQSAEGDIYIVRGGYGYNWLWSHWYSGAELGLGYNYYQVKYEYADAVGQASNLRMNSFFGISVGYQWVKTKLGLFSKAQTWVVGFDDKEIQSNTSTAGIYLSSVF